MPTTFTVTGQSPHRLSPYDITPPLTADPADPGAEYDLVKVLAALAENSLMTPLTPGGSVRVECTDDAGVVTPVDAGAFGQILAAPLVSDAAGGTPGDTPENNAKAMNLLSQTTVDIRHDRYPFVRQMFTAQALGEAGLPAPGPTVIYNVNDDVITPARQLLATAGKTTAGAAADAETAWQLLTLGLSTIYKPSTLGIAFLSEDDFAAFCEHLVTVASALSGTRSVSGDTVAKCRQLASEGLSGLTLGLTLRNSPAFLTEDYSFARLLVHEAMSWAKREQDSASADDRAARAWAMPFDVAEWICPQTVVFVSAESHARRSAEDIDTEWKRTCATLNGGLKLVSNKYISKLNALPTALTGLKQSVRARKDKGRSMRREASENDFASVPPAPNQAAKQIIDHLRAMNRVNQSQNIIRLKKKTMNRASRRRPHDPNVPGKTVVKTFYPDLHLFADTSGSMSMTDYQDIIMLAIVLAKKLDVNLYFSSHSHILSPETLVQTKGRSVPQIKKAIAKIPKVSGGNRFELVYEYVQARQVTRDRLSILASDFGWAATSSMNFTHPKNLIYTPAFDRRSQAAWDTVRNQASAFVNSMRPFEPQIDNRLYGMGYTVPPTIPVTP